MGLTSSLLMKLPARSNFGDSMENRSSTVSNTSGWPYSARLAIAIGSDDFTISGISACSAGSDMPGGTPWNNLPPSSSDSPWSDR